CLRKLKSVLWDFDRALPNRVDAPPDFGPQVVECKRAVVVLIQPLEGRLILRVVREDQVLGQALVSFRCLCLQCCPWAFGGQIFNNLFQCNPALLSVLACQRVLHIAQHRVYRRTGIGALESSTRFRTIRAQLFQPALRLFSDVFEGSSEGDLAWHRNLPSVARSPLSRGRNEGSCFVRTRLGGSRLPCRG